VDSPALLFVVDAGAEIGGGHVMRSLTLAKALADRGARPAFLAPPEVQAVLDRFAPPGVASLRAPSLEPAALIEAAASAAGGFEAVVFDHFRIGAAEQRRARAGRPGAAVDDLADRPLDVDLVIDLGPDRTEQDYDGLLPAGAELRLGPAYALVRPEFAEARDTALARRGAGEVGRVLVSLGLTDVGGVTRRVLDRMLPRLGEAAVDVVLGQAAPSRDAVERLAARDPRVTLHIEARDMAALMTAADLAVGAGGATTWERCTVGLPTLNLILAENQAPSARALDRMGAVATVDARSDAFEAAFDRAFTGLMRSPEKRARMARVGAGLCDGRGAARAAEAVLGLLRP
jgi:UDP-2,4-diacetamido-2,4,6-trideoxy-beta-L-altropyranose hydrolase